MFILFFVTFVRVNANKVCVCNFGTFYAVLSLWFVVQSAMITSNLLVHDVRRRFNQLMLIMIECL